MNDAAAGDHDPFIPAFLSFFLLLRNYSIRTKAREYKKATCGGLVGGCVGDLLPYVIRRPEVGQHFYFHFLMRRSSLLLLLWYLLLLLS